MSRYYGVFSEKVNFKYAMARADNLHTYSSRFKSRMATTFIGLFMLYLDQQHIAAMKSSMTLPRLSRSEFLKQFKLKPSLWRNDFFLRYFPGPWDVAFDSVCDKLGIYLDSNSDNSGTFRFNVTWLKKG